MEGSCRNTPLVWPASHLGLASVCFFSSHRLASYCRCGCQKAAKAKGPRTFRELVENVRDLYHRWVQKHPRMPPKSIACTIYSSYLVHLFSLSYSCSLSPFLLCPSGLVCSFSLSQIEFTDVVSTADKLISFIYSSWVSSVCYLSEGYWLSFPRENKTTLTIESILFSMNYCQVIAPGEPSGSR